MITLGHFYRQMPNTYSKHKCTHTHRHTHNAELYFIRSLQASKLHSMLFASFSLLQFYVNWPWVYTVRASYPASFPNFVHKPLHYRRGGTWERGSIYQLVFRFYLHSNFPIFFDWPTRSFRWTEVISEVISIWRWRKANTQKTNTYNVQPIYFQLLEFLQGQP